MAGKGYQIRKGANRKAYRENYDDIFRKDKEQPKFSGKVTCKNCNRKITADKYKNGYCYFCNQKISNVLL